jgi:nucleotide-binding universal stress UspA family protein
MTEPNAPRCTRIVVHIDLTDAAIPAVEYARILAASLGATLHFLHVVKEPLSAGWTAELQPFAFPEVQQAMEVEAEQWLDGVIPESEQERFEASLDVETGEIAEEIIRCAHDHEADLIVVSAKAEGADADMTERLLRKVRCSVLVVRP